MAEFKPRFIEGHVKANRLKPSSAEAYESLYRNYLWKVIEAMPCRIRLLYDFSEYRRLVEGAACGGATLRANGWGGRWRRDGDDPTRRHEAE